MEKEDAHSVNIRLAYAYGNMCYRNVGPLENLHSLGKHLNMSIYEKANIWNNKKKNRHRKKRKKPSS